MSASRTVVVIGWLFGLLGTVAAIGLEGVWVSDRPFGDVFSADLLNQVLDIEFGRVWFARALLWVLAGVVLADLLRRGEQAARSTAWRVGLIGHALDAPSPLWAQLAGLVHLTGIVLWIGGLAVLLLGVLPRRRPEELAVVGAPAQAAGQAEQARGAASSVSVVEHGCDPSARGRDGRAARR